MRAPRKPVLAGAIVAICISILGPASAFSECADLNDDGNVTPADALGILKAAVGIDLCEVYLCDVDGSGTVGPSDALNALKFAVGQQILLDCPDDPGECLDDMDFFFQRVWTPILTDCVACHNPSGIASYTEHVLLPETEEGYLAYNFNVLKNLAITKADLILSKPQGINHGGGQRLGITPQSIHYDHLVELLERFDSPVPDCGADSNFWAGVSYLSDLEALNKATMLFAGRRPTDWETNHTLDNGETGLREAIWYSMDGESFDNFIRETANDRLLTDKYLIRQSHAFGVLQGDYQYPSLYEKIELIEFIQGEDAAEEAWHKTNVALAREPLEMFVYIANNERPYTEIVSGDYKMMNPYSAAVYDDAGGFSSNYDENEWRPRNNYGYRLPNYPHAGILSSPMFLARFPSTATNRNRARARWIYKFFLGVDIESLAPRLVNPADVDEAENPTMNNSSCTVCHAVLDPVAATLQNFGDDGIYLESDSDSLPHSYKRTDLYQHGDRWYRDMRAPGFNDAVMPASETDRSLEWLGDQIAADPRFARGAVEFWYQGVFGRPPLLRPTDPSQSDYSARLSAYAAQQEMFDEIAGKFRDGTAGTGWYGPHNLKNLLIELAASPLFRAAGASNVDEERSAEVAGLGRLRLLTPEQLNRKFESTTGHVWANSWEPDEPHLLDRYRIFFGGIDSSGIIKRADELNALMATVPQRMAFEMACPIAVSEFSKSASQRLLFPFVEPDDLPGDPSGEGAIRANIAWLHQWLLGEMLTDDDPVVDTTLGLFNNIRQLRISQGKTTRLSWGSGECALDWDDDSYIEYDDNQTIRSWIAVLVYLLSDYRFIYE